jgi:imidazolonepropionase-like amidohydrolase
MNGRTARGNVMAAQTGASRGRQSARAVLASLAAILILSCLAATGRAADKVTVLRVGLLIDGSGGEAIKDAVIVIEGKRVQAVGRSGEVTVPAGAEIIQFADKTVIPGLVDSHAHYREWEGELYIANGVTTAFDVGDNPLVWSFAQKDGIEKGKITGPRLLLSGRMNGIGGEDSGEGGSRGRVEEGIKTPEQAREKVRKLLATPGVDSIKALEALSPDLLRVIVEEAHRAGKPVITHSVNGTEAVLAGIPIDSIEHSHSVMLGTIGSEDARKRLNEERSGPDRITSQEAQSFAEEQQYNRVIQAMVAQNVYWTPTMATSWRAFSPLRERFAADERRLLSLPQLNYIPPYFRENTLGYFTGTAKLGPKLQASVQSGYTKLKDFIHRFVQAGGKLQTGSDPNAGIPAVTIHEEMALFVEAGLTPMQALLAATKNPATRRGREKDFGVIAPGSFADLVVLDGNPLDDISATQRIHLVFQEGRPIKPEYHADYRNPIPRTQPDRQPPEIEQVSPETVTEGEGPVTLTITGRNFVNTTLVKFNGTPLPAEVKFRIPNFPQNFMRSRQLTVTLPAELLQKAGTYPLVVEHPGLGGAVSSPAYVIVKFR